MRCSRPWTHNNSPTLKSNRRSPKWNRRAAREIFSLPMPFEPNCWRAVLSWRTPRTAYDGNENRSVDLSAWGYGLLMGMSNTQDGRLVEVTAQDLQPDG